MTKSVAKLAEEGKVSIRCRLVLMRLTSQSLQNHMLLWSC